MGYEKIVTLAERCAKYAAVCGKRSILETNPVTKIPKPETLGYICPDGTINFSSVESAIQYARTKCVKALQGKNPVEHCVGIKESKIIGETTGNNNSVDVDFYENIADICCHGHPDTYTKGCTTAPGFPDFFNLASNEFQKKEIVFNSLGEYYVLEKMPNFSFVMKPAFNGVYDSDIPIKLVKHLFQAFPKDVQKELDIAIKTNNVDLFEQIYLKYIDENNLSKELTDLTHTFWLKYAKELGVKIDTNFSNFKDLIA